MMPRQMDEFLPVQHFYRISRLWWLVVVATLIGTACAYIFHRFNPPEYEATATLQVSIDLVQLPFLADISGNKLQYNEDLALSTTELAFRSPETYQAVVTRCEAQGLPIPDVHMLYANHSLERRHANWQLHYRHTDPQVAKEVVNIWTELAYETMITWQATGEIPEYLLVKAPILADLPEEPFLYDLYRLLLAGGLIGLMIGILLSDALARKDNASQTNSIVE